jgi:stage II sporulation protein D
MNPGTMANPRNPAARGGRRARPTAAAIALVLAATLALPACGLRAVRAPEPIPAAGGPRLRVLLEDRAREARLTADSEIHVEPTIDDPSVYDGSVIVYPKEGGLSLADPQTGAERRVGSEVHVSAPDGSGISVAGRRYRGAIVVRAIEGALRVVNEIALEDYLLGVVPGEIGRLDEPQIEAAKAQAVAARTYSVSSMGQYGSEGYDLVAGVIDQVYEGVRGENPLVSRAVMETAGLVVAYRGGLARTYYSSTCGGRTAEVHEAWPERAGAPYLRGGIDRTLRRDVDEALCAGSPHFAWTEEWGGRQLDDLLAQYLPLEVGLPPGTNVGHLTDIRILTRGRSGRAIELELTTTTGTYVVKHDRIRWVLRRPGSQGAILRSTLIRVEAVEREAGRVRRLVVTGRGNGHGIGLCQSGSIHMSEIGYSFREILKHYYRGAEIRLLAEVRGLPPALSGRDPVRRMLAWIGAPPPVPDVAQQ